MKSPISAIVLLPLALNAATAAPAEDSSSSLTARGSGGGKDPNPCQVRVSYPYYKFPCASSPENGTSILGATFTSFCYYENGEESGKWFKTPRGWVKDEDKPRRCDGSTVECVI
ncbi:uncharacterized protein BO95DRAFT_445087 [Aspergillus brunneoviolaceus CBS 621.78]|uniref:Uncharacterized protein n=1 Tax=Aspergillus brunneoviolaceus CBS 621.78 TaxID=1450534 RepID=A0ACD1G2M4_9EURO|nr:hypothetical protein BO95DRAFT_445087 [Aspergillus brunneoviolaceus CBS 621.78]RAH43526.1 hypothetical protein BO95DRAFT_445087 [Aspergillus brunneoviolaceus CBS 621.78]